MSLRTAVFQTPLQFGFLFLNKRKNTLAKCPNDQFPSKNFLKIFLGFAVAGCCFIYSFFIFFFFFFSLGLYPWHMEVPGLRGRIRATAEVNTTATAMPDLSHIWDLRCSLWQHQIINPLSEARDRTCTLQETMSGSQPTEPQWEFLVTDLCSPLSTTWLSGRCFFIACFSSQGLLCFFHITKKMNNSLCLHVCSLPFISLC